MSLGERRLVRRLKQRDERAFREMVLRFQRPVYTMVFRMLGSAEEAEDLAQEVFITVFKAIDTFRGDSKLSTWIFRIAANHCRNRHKYLARRHYRSTQQLSDANEGALLSAADSIQAQFRSPERALEDRRLDQAIQQELASLDEEQRLVVVLRDIEGLSYQEITKIAGVAEGTVKSRLHRARMALKKGLAARL
jgi:RNA polymerase sigma-70 factor (ECF subfamily)